MRALKALLVVPLLTLGWCALMPVGPAGAASIADACPGSSLSGTTYTLMTDCVVTEPLGVPDGFTLDGAGHTLTPGPAGWAVQGRVGDERRRNDAPEESDRAGPRLAGVPSALWGALQ